MARPPLRLRIERAIAGFKAKEFIPPLPSLDRDGADGAARINTYRSKEEQLTANVGWCFTANNAISEPFSAIPIKLYKKTKAGEREEIKEHEILSLISAPNLALTGEQLRQLHATYMNFTGESYIYMRDGARPFEPRKGRLPDALDIFPAHRVQFELGSTYTQSTVKLAGEDYPVTSFIRDITSDPDNPYKGRSIIAASAAAVDLDNQTKAWNQGVFARARSLASDVRRIGRSASFRGHTEA